MRKEASAGKEQALLMEHIASRKGWGRYVEVMTKVRREVVNDADEFLSDLRKALDQALQRDRDG